jgi:prolyl-tRNA editing enzyme YbaK/EbsC (Cys-tRNA(Pro) deacylase)
MLPGVAEATHPTVLKLKERLATRGLDVEPVELPASTRTAADAAAACGCELGQIVKSLVFRDAATGEPVVCLWAGDHQVPAEELGLERASADEARAATGFAVGGVPPLGHDRPLRTIVDPSLSRYETVWCAAGTPNTVFEVETAMLLAAVEAETGAPESSA